MTCSEYSAENLREQFARDERVSELGIEVTISGDHAFLRGKVSTPERRDAAGTVAREFLPDCTIVNEVTVIDLEKPHLETLG